MILQGAGNDFRGRRGTTVDEDHDGFATRQVAARLGVEALGLIRSAPAGRDDLASVDERIDDVDRLVEQPPRIVAQIEVITLEFVGRDVAVQLLHRALQAVPGLLSELSDADVADVAILDMRAHRLDVDKIADDGEILDVLLGAANDLELHRRIDRAAHFLDRLIERQPLCGCVVDGRYDVAREDARLGGWRIVDRGYALEKPVFLRYLDAKAAELALRLDLHIAKRFGVHVARMRIERGEHAVNRGLDHFRFVWLLRIVVSDVVEYVAEHIELPISVGDRSVSGGADEQQRLRRRGRGCSSQNDSNSQVTSFTNHPRAFSMSDFAHHGPGSIAVPSLRSSI